MCFFRLGTLCIRFGYFEMSNHDIVRFNARRTNTEVPRVDFPQTVVVIHPMECIQIRRMVDIDVIGGTIVVGIFTAVATKIPIALAKQKQPSMLEL